MRIFAYGRIKAFNKDARKTQGIPWDDLVNVLVVRLRWMRCNPPVIFAGGNGVATDVCPDEASQGLLCLKGADDAYFRGIAVFARQLGFEFCSYMAGNPGAAFMSQQFATISNYSPAWQQCYQEHEFHLLDPTVRYARKKSRPLVWDENVFNDPVLRFETEREGLRHGWTRPFQGVGERFGMFTLARKDGPLADNELKAKQPMMEWLARIAHFRFYPTLLAKLQRSATGAPSDREIEILKLSAEGLTASEISSVLQITERTVNYHIGNITEKLGASNRTHALVCAVRAGLIRL
jgi:LuxR family transcriptional regulator